MSFQWGAPFSPMSPNFPMHPSQFFNDFRQMSSANNHQPEQGKESVVEVTKSEYKIILNATHFKPEELVVKVVERTIKIEAKHEEKEDENGGTVERHITRKYLVPEQFDMALVESRLTMDGKLCICVKALPESDINIPIIRENH